MGRVLTLWSRSKCLQGKTRCLYMALQLKRYLHMSESKRNWIVQGVQCSKYWCHIYILSVCSRPFPADSTCISLPKKLFLLKTWKLLFKGNRFEYEDNQYSIRVYLCHDWRNLNKNPSFLLVLKGLSLHFSKIFFVCGVTFIKIQSS